MQTIETLHYEIAGEAGAEAARRMQTHARPKIGIATIAADLVGARLIVDDERMLIIGAFGPQRPGEWRELPDLLLLAASGQLLYWRLNEETFIMPDGVETRFDKGYFGVERDGQVTIPCCEFKTPAGRVITVGNPARIVRADVTCPPAPRAQMRGAVAIICPQSLVCAAQSGTCTPDQEPTGRWDCRCL